jgi:hypoxanthine-DNA glycosylase
MFTDTTVKSFESISTPDCTAIILGTMPGVQSLTQNQYYGHPDNVFWDIIIRIFSPSLTEDEIENLSYNDKTKLLIENKIALWDVLQYCDRKGSLDSSIKNEIKNDFVNFFGKHKHIRTIFFNGQKAEKFFIGCFKDLIERHGLTKIILPSTSPSHSMNTFKKLKEWRIALSAG